MECQHGFYSTVDTGHCPQEKCQANDDGGDAPDEKRKEVEEQRGGDSSRRPASLIGCKWKTWIER